MAPEEKEWAVLISNVATQMRSALGNLHLAAAQLVPMEQREQDPAMDARAAVMDQSYYQLLRLVNNLTLAGSLGDERPLTLQNRDLAELAGELCERAAGVAPYLNLNVRFVCALESCVCAVDPVAVEQILNHLLSNAFKFTPAGGTVTVELRRRNGRVLLSVEDTGCGIPEERLEFLFEQHLQNGRLDPQPHGLGLGLPICKHLAEGLGGVLMTESRVGVGSRFTLSLPDRRTDQVTDVPFGYSGGFNSTLLALADALPAKAFLVRYQD